FFNASPSALSLKEIRRKGNEALPRGVPVQGAAGVSLPLTVVGGPPASLREALRAGGLER
ncbi:MAG TPA: hypothetical protein PLB55_23255, partial [Prosthecobacter sp.]|nr:hypothetical protein [Prosthecobacter sp.]